MRSLPRALLLCALAAACQDLSNKPSPYVVLAPILDSLFVGDQSPPPTVTYYDGQGGSSNPAPGQVSWSSSDATILAVNTTGRMTGVKRGTALVFADVQGVVGLALIIVSSTLDLTLLTDTIYLMPGDTFTVPVAVLKSSPPAPTVSYEAPSNAVYSINPTSGLISALSTGGPVRYIVHADTVADTGAVQVLSLSDTVGGKFFFSVLGTAITHVGGSIRAVHYTRSNGKLAFRLRGTYPLSSGSIQQVVQITLPDTVNTAAGGYPIDSLGAAEAAVGFGQPPAICAPPRPWALWSAQNPPITALSRPAGALDITQLTTVSSGNGRAISGRFFYLAQRTDLYDDPLGVLTVRGTFVAPLVEDRTSCQ